MASTRLNEQGWSPDVIERQLAHAERNKIRAAYNRAQYLPERRRMMQAWSDDLDGGRCGWGMNEWMNVILQLKTCQTIIHLKNWVERNKKPTP